MTTLHDSATTYRGVARSELVEDFRLALVSRYLDDREISLQKQSRVFFQISGAGHEALLLALARSLRPGYDWFFPYYRDRSLVLGLGVTPDRDPAPGGRARPTTRRRAGGRCRATGATASSNIVTQSSATGSQCIPAVGCAEATRYIQGRNLPGVRGPRRRDHLRVARRGRHVGGRVLGEPQHRVPAAPAGALRRGRQRLRHLGARRGPVAGADLGDGARASAAWRSRSSTGATTSPSRHFGARAIARVRAGEGPGLIHAKVTRPYSHSAADTQTQVPPAGGAGRRGRARPDPPARAGAGQGRRAHRRGRRAHPRRGQARSWPPRPRRRWPRPGPTRRRCSTTCTSLPPIPDAGPAAGDDGEVVAFGEAIRRTLHELMARRRAHPGVRRGRRRRAGGGARRGRGQGRRVRHHPRPAARASASPAASTRRWPRPTSSAGPSARRSGGCGPCPEIQFFDYIWPAMTQIKSEAATIRWRSNGAWTLPDGAAGADRRLPHRRVDLAQPVRRVDLRPRPRAASSMFPSRARDAAGLLRAAFRCEDPVLFLEHKHLLRQPYTRDPFPPRDYVIPLGPGDVRAAGATTSRSSRTAPPSRSRGRPPARSAEPTAPSVEIIDLRCLDPVGPGAGRRVGARAPAGRSSCTRTSAPCGFGGEVAAWIARASASPTSTRRSAGSARTDCHVAYEPTLEDAILPQVDDIAAEARRLLAY